MAGSATNIDISIRIRLFFIIYYFIYQVALRHIV